MSALTVTSRSVARVLQCMLAISFVLGTVSPVRGQSAENVAIVINENSAASQRIGEYYARKHALPAANVIRIKTSTDETVDRLTYLTTIETVIATALTRQDLQDRILYIVLTKGIPLRVAGTTGPQGWIASVDSELT